MSPSLETRPSSHSTCRLPNGRHMAYVTAGDPTGRPVIACHGTPGSGTFARFYHDVAREAGVRVLAPDRPGIGGSPPAADRTVADWAADVSGLLSALDVERASVLGFSGGGPHALACAARCDRVDRAAVVAGMAPTAAVSYPRMLSLLGTLVRRTPRLAGVVYRLQAALVRRGPSGAILSVLTDEAVGDVVVAGGSGSGSGADSRPGAGPGRGPATVAEVLTAELQSAFAAGVWGAVADTRAVTADWGFDPSSVAVPVRWWHGTADVNVPPAAADWAERTLSDVTVEAIEGRDHLGALVGTRAAVAGWV